MGWRLGVHEVAVVVEAKAEPLPSPLQPLRSSQRRPEVPRARRKKCWLWPPRKPQPRPQLPTNLWNPPLTTTATTVMGMGRGKGPVPRGGTTTKRGIPQWEQTAQRVIRGDNMSQPLQGVVNNKGRRKKGGIWRRTRTIRAAARSPVNLFNVQVQGGQVWDCHQRTDH